MSLSHFSLGLSAWKSRLSRFVTPRAEIVFCDIDKPGLGIKVISPVVEFLGLLITVPLPDTLSIGMFLPDIGRVVVIPAFLEEGDKESI
jgi:hypothetical protein